MKQFSAVAPSPHHKKYNTAEKSQVPFFFYTGTTQVYPEALWSVPSLRVGTSGLKDSEMNVIM